ncbi:MAG TPA: hypothetical protein ENJ20_07385 [Bacteroidetes bacterium]|nr:hypothetical protein [Bacteroidota bacterium]
MKNTVLPFLLFTFLLTFVSCEKEALDAPLSTQEPSAFSMAMAKETIVFHVSRKDIATGMQTGFIIDNNGRIKTYLLSKEQAAALPSGRPWPENAINYLNGRATNIAGSVPEAELITYYKKILPASGGSLSSVLFNVNDAPDYTLTFQAFVAREKTDYATGGHNSGGTCGSSGEQAITTTVHTPYLLAREGQEQQLNEHPDAQLIVQWLRVLMSDAGL